MNLFNKFYQKNLHGIRPNGALKRELRRHLGFGRSFTAAWRILVIAPAALVLIVSLVAIDRYEPHVLEKTTNRLAAVFESGRDDWQYRPTEQGEAYFGKSVPSAALGLGSMPASIGLAPPGVSADFGLSAAPAVGLSAAPTLGLATGGAKDIETFRSNILNGYLPKRSALTYEGLFGDYFFDTGRPAACTELFCPTYARAVSADPISGREDLYLAVGLNSNLRMDDFRRPPLDLVIVLDISGSMAERLESYYYDARPSPLAATLEAPRTKLDAAKESIIALLDHLRDDDRLGIVLFDDQSYLAQPFGPIIEMNRAALKAHLLEIQPRGGTNMTAGMDRASNLIPSPDYAGLPSSADLPAAEDRQRRIIFLTDAMPNSGDVSEAGMLGQIRRNADTGLYTTFIGIGVDFQTDLIETITKVKGANYYSVRTVDEFRRRLDKNFDYLVTPLVFDLELKLEARGYEIERVYGSPEADESTGQLLKVRTLFPSETDERGTRGGLVLLKLKRVADDTALRLVAGYTDAAGRRQENDQVITFDGATIGQYDHLGIRKGVLLSRYADLLGNWIVDELRRQDGFVQPLLTAETGLRPLPLDATAVSPSFSRWEQGSVPLTISNDYRELFVRFRDHFRTELPAIGDDELRRELDLLDRLIAAPTN